MCKTIILKYYIISSKYNIYYIYTDEDLNPPNVSTVDITNVSKCVKV